MNKLIGIGIIALAVGSIGCSRISSGEVGVRVNASKEIVGTELMPGSWNQTLIGDVLEFPVRDITVSVENKTPLTADNSALADFDVTVVYGINPTSVAEIYTKKSKSFHAYDKNGDIYLMHNYIATLVNNAAYKTVRQYKSLEVADNRAKIEAEIKQIVADQLKAEGLVESLSLTVVQVRNVQPNPEILKAATEYVKSQNELKIKETEIAIASKEAEKQKILSQNATQNIAYMNAQANLMVAEGIKNGKAQLVVVPFDFKGMVNVGK